MSGNRRKSRELALQVLFQSEFAEGQAAGDLTEQVQYFQESFAIEKDVLDYAIELLSGIQKNRESIDSTISGLSSNWSLTRMSKVDLNILRIAVFEIQHFDQIPARVAINEAVELAKKYGNTESGGFINGLLDAVMNKV